MRYLIDTNIFVYLALDIEMLSRNVKAILEEPDTLLYISVESVRELIVGYRNKGLTWYSMKNNTNKTFPIISSVPADMPSASHAYKDFQSA